MDRFVASCKAGGVSPCFYIIPSDDCAEVREIARVLELKITLINTIVSSGTGFFLVFPTFEHLCFRLLEESVRYEVVVLKFNVSVLR